MWLAHALLVYYRLHVLLQLLKHRQCMGFHIWEAIKKLGVVNQAQASLTSLAWAQLPQTLHASRYIAIASYAVSMHVYIPILQVK